MGRRHGGKVRAMRKQVLVAVLLACALGVGTTVAGAAGGSKDEETYLLTFDDGVDADAVLAEVQRAVPVTVERTFGTVIRGAVVTTSAVPEAIDMVPGVATVDKDVEFSLPDDELVPVDDEDPDGSTTTSTTTTSTSTTSTLPDDTTTTTTTTPPPKPVVPWGLDRTDQRALPLSDSYKSPHNGSGVIVYVLDSGITPHQEFGDRLAPGTNLVAGPDTTRDCTGHGTHVAGTIGGTTVGVAPGVTLVPVRMLDCEGEGTRSLAAMAMEWVIANHPRDRRAVVNMSAGGSQGLALERAVRELIAIGVPVVVSAGNTASSACNSATGTEVVGAIVVGASRADDVRADFSNVGPCVDIFAPGEQVRSASINGSSSYEVHDGTSMAAPHVAGAAAVILGQDPWRSARQVESAIITESTTGVIADAGSGSPDRLLYVDPGRAPAPPTPDTGAAPPPPVVRSADTERPFTAQTAVLALTGGDTRALLTLGSLLLIAGLVLVAAARRRARDLTPVMAAPTAPPLSGFEFRHHRRRP